MSRTGDFVSDCSTLFDDIETENSLIDTLIKWKVNLKNSKKILKVMGNNEKLKKRRGFIKIKKIEDENKKFVQRRKKNEKNDKIFKKKLKQAKLLAKQFYVYYHVDLTTAMSEFKKAVDPEKLVIPTCFWG